MESLLGHTSGFAVPSYVVDAPGGGGKIRLMPNYLLSSTTHRVVLRNFEGLITTYEEPLDYQPHDPAQCAFVGIRALRRARRASGGCWKGRHR